MKGFPRVLLFLAVMASAALANPWGGPGACVHLINVYLEKPLLSSDYNHDADRRHVTVLRTKSQNWVITPDERYPDHYKIKHKNLGEELFESEQNWNGNYVFTWIPKTLINDGGASWKIIWISDGTYLIKNKKFNHCLWTQGTDNWVGAYAGCDNSHYYWKIHKIPCAIGET